MLLLRQYIKCNKQFVTYNYFEFYIRFIKNEWFYLIEETVTIYRKEYDGLFAIIAELREEILSIKEEIRLLKNGKKSNTSHTPPSQDIGRSNQKNSREISEKKSGGQKGHKGFTLEMTNNPDEVIKYSPNFCT